MYLSDYHTHCSLSFDSKTPVEDMVRAGIAQGLQEMCLTDHVDLFRPRETAHWEHDFSNREETFARADQAADGKIIVRRGIECNVNRGNTPLPDAKWLRRYHELGGEIITIGTDAHTPEFVGMRARETQELLKNCGLDYVCTFEKKKPVFHKI